jgi:thioredoxin 1
MPHIAKKYEGKAQVGMVNSAANFSLSSKYGIHAVPTVLAFKDGIEVARLKGLHPPETYKQLMEDITTITI